MFDVQLLIVAPLVAASFVYTAWTLMPAAARRALALRLRRIRVLANWAPLRSAVDDAAPACTGCAGCDDAPPTRRRDGSAVITLTRKARRRPPWTRG